MSYKEVRARGVVTGRSLLEISAFHGLELQAFADKTILDAGCGLSSLQDDLIYSRVDGACVVGLDIANDVLSDHLAITQHPNLPVQGSLEQFPFMDGSFDVALGTYSLPMWAEDESMITKFFGEMARVTKPDGGIMSIYPLQVSYSMAEEQGVDRWRQLASVMRMAASDIANDPGWFEIRHDPEGFTAIRI